MSDAKDGAEWLAEAVKTGSKIWADVPDNFVSKLRGNMNFYTVKLEGFGEETMAAESPEEAALDRIKRYVNSTNLRTMNRVVYVDGVKYGVMVGVSVDYKVVKL